MINLLLIATLLTSTLTVIITPALASISGGRDLTEEERESEFYNENGNVYQGVTDPQ
jgi:hypothetical protein